MARTDLPWLTDPAAPEAAFGGPVVGIDEAGRGPWAGPVTAAAVILDSAVPIAGLQDSKQTNLRQREHLRPLILEHSFAWGIAFASAAEIDALDIRQATHLAWRRALVACLEMALSRRMPQWPGTVLIDGNDRLNLSGGGDLPEHLMPAGPLQVATLVDGDARAASIAAASILAKTDRDATMRELDKTYPGYGFATHKGYGTLAHRQALAALGPCPQHRHSFRPVAAARGSV